MFAFFHRILFFFQPETAHHIAVFFLKLLPVKKDFSKAPVYLPKVASLSFKNRVGLAAGFDKNAEVFPALSNFGFGFIEVGTVTPVAQKGNPKPRLWRTPEKTLVNQMGFNNCGLEIFKENIVKGRKKTSIPLLANIGKNKATPNAEAYSDYEKGFLALKDCVDGFVVNISSPNTPNLRDLQSQGFLEKILSFAPTTVPIFVKFSADLESNDLVSLLDFVGKSRFSGVVLVNTSSKLAVDFAGKTSGGLSGTRLFEKALEKVSLAKEVLKDSKTIIGVGGVSSVEQYLKMRKAGADLVEVYTAFVYQGPRLVQTLANVEATSV